MAGQLSRRETGLRPWWENSPVAGFRQEMDRLFSQFFNDEAGGPGIAALLPSLDLSETENEIEVHMDLPGFKRDEIDVNLHRDTLSVSGEHKEEKEDKEDDRRYHHIERRRGRFHRTVQLPAIVQEDEIDANFKDGVLTIRMPKAEESKPRKISVKG